MKQFDFNSSKDDVELIIKKIDTDGNGTIELDEFLNFIARYIRCNKARSTDKTSKRISRKCFSFSTKMAMASSLSRN
jgi:Ca2+-binding EF-hand superfamily protein